MVRIVQMVKEGVTRNSLRCATRSTFTGFRGGDLNTYLTTQWLVVASLWTCRHFILPRQVWHTDPVGIEDLVGLGRKFEAGAWHRVLAAAGTFSDCVTRVREERADRMWHIFVNVLLGHTYQISNIGRWIYLGEEPLFSCSQLFFFLGKKHGRVM